MPCCRTRGNRAVKNSAEANQQRRFTLQWLDLSILSRFGRLDQLIHVIGMKKRVLADSSGGQARGAGGRSGSEYRDHMEQIEIRSSVLAEATTSHVFDALTVRVTVDTN